MRIERPWGVDQSDRRRLAEIVAREFDGPLDLVLDDASHSYEPTKASFEALFPLLRPHGLYVIEDWAWEYWESIQTPDHPLWNEKTRLTKLIFELVEATGSREVMRPRLISNVSIFHVFMGVERGDLALPTSGDFALEAHFCRGPATASNAGAPATDGISLPAGAQL